ncbi:MAG: PLP-dependent transferase, partial [Clostridiales bacterium]|nr:PLP-dependent transferase [Clostridiales bacterium]
MKFNTALLHSGYDREKSTGSTIIPIYQVNAFSQDSAEKLEKVFNDKAYGYAYS